MTVRRFSRALLLLSLLTLKTWPCLSKTATSKKDFRQTILDRQNHFREMHGVPPFQMNENLNLESQAWAEKLAHDCKASYSKFSDRAKTMGGYTAESLVPRHAPTGNPSDPDANQHSLANKAAEHFYSKITDYPFPVYTGAYNGSFNKFRQFSQAVWKSTKNVGYGYAVNPNCSQGPMEYLVVRYFPGGNLIGRFKDNVFPVKELKSSDKLSTKEQPGVAVVGPMEEGLQLGLKMLNETIKNLCWYDDVKVFPYSKGGPRKGMPSICFKTVDSYLIQFVQPNLTDLEFLGKIITQVGEKTIPDYHSKCENFVKDPKATPERDESDALNDGRKDYPFKGYCHCLIQTFRKLRGDGAVEDLKKERTYARKNFLQTMLERENQFRIRHGVEPLRLNQTLVEDAQKWADKMASECHRYHSKPADSRMPGWTGENLCSFSHIYEPDSRGIHALECANGMYSEIEFYPFPEGLDDAGDSRPPGNKVGHFTATVWKNTSYVGYGIAFNPECKHKGKDGVYGKDGSIAFVAGRYFPGGNIQSEYNNNVFPPKGSKEEKEVEKYKADNQEPVKMGIIMFEETFYRICWYIEMNLGKSRDKFGNCVIHPQTFLKHQNDSNLSSFSATLSGNINAVGSARIPDFHTKCEQLLKTPSEAPKKDEGDALNDKGKKYAFKAYFHCLIQALREKHGDKAIEEIKKEMSQNKKTSFVEGSN